ncbi:protein arginine N-methyltransferase 5-like [Anopheles albimanus]|uniref:Protein arginine N-methyltransferase n=1 Tax=Anopheles albimanus TaxID=7167 RepID=A0A182F3M4_ANOAL|nr:protein arginine N-methyltransferase 5-like [Anopheles albimanus]
MDQKNQKNPRVSVSHYLDTAGDLKVEIERAGKCNFSAIVVPVVHWRFDREFVREPLCSKHGQFTRSDLLLCSGDWMNKVICRVSDSTALDAPIEGVRRQAERTLLQEMSFAQHLAHQGYLYTRLSGSNCTNFARTIVSCLSRIMLVEVPLTNPKSTQHTWRSDVNGEDPPAVEDTWNWWNTFRSHADYNPNLKVALELTADVPRKPEMYRWLGEPVDAVVLPASIFLTNVRNYPVLSKAHQSIVTMLYRTFSCHFIVKANPSDGHLAHYVDYIKHIVETNYVSEPMQGYDDVLEIPLQPLYDNLDSNTYEIFELDPVKYIRYQDAIEQALRDRVPEEKVAEDKPTIIMVVGGGRGPLVRAALNASVKAERPIKVYVIEKNPNAIVTLTALIEEMWKDRNVELISTDMREFSPPEKADILVSELLGSFGDNELSPECLDGAQKHLKDDGVSIPCKSTSYLCPCMSTKVYNQVRSLERVGHLKDRVVSSRHMEQMYVAYLKNVYHIADPQALFEFVHPNRSVDPIDNSRYKVLRFKASLDCVLNGFQGHFDTVLYKDIQLSIHPFTHDIGLVSWFSMFIPLTEPVQVKAGDEIVIHIWRCVASHKVWYEWSLASPTVTHVHNINGRGHPIWK